jgi:transcriptional regulator with XRE-family HTH domain
MRDITTQEIGKLLREARERKNKKQTEVAEAIGVSASAISQWERGEKDPKLQNIYKFCQFLEMTIDELLETKRSRKLYLELTEEERDTILSMLDGCKQETKTRSFQSRLQFLEQHLKAFFSRAQSK